LPGGHKFLALQKNIYAMNNTTSNIKQKKILFACFPADGHFNPMTGLAVHLANAGYDVRWYTSAHYADKLKKLRVPHYTLKKAIDIHTNDLEKNFPERKNITRPLAKLKFDIIHAFIKRGPEYYEDIQEIYKDFPFDMLIADAAFTGAPFVKELMKIPVVGIGIFPLTEKSKDLPPAGLGLEPSFTFFGKVKQSLLRTFADKVIFKKPDSIMHRIFDEWQVPHNNESLFDMMIKKCDLFLQSGTPGFEYKRSDLSEHVAFVGPLLPYSANRKTEPWFDERMNKYPNVVLVTQGTAEKDVQKLLVPALQAFKGSDTLVICTTGGSDTEKLQQQFPQPNFIIKDFIPFADVMPYADVYITNGGYGGVMLGIENKLPMVVAGVHEGKNEICARVGYFKLGVNLKTEKPTAAQINEAVGKILSDKSYQANVETLAREFAQYSPNELSEKYIAGLLLKNSSTAKPGRKPVLNLN